MPIRLVGDKADIKAVLKVVYAYEAAYQIDIEGMLSHKVDDAVFLPHGYPSAEGKEDITAWVQMSSKMHPTENYSVGFPESTSAIWAAGPHP